jgi:hypothetical protein
MQLPGKPDIVASMLQLYWSFSEKLRAELEASLQHRDSRRLSQAAQCKEMRQRR